MPDVHLTRRQQLRFAADAEFKKADVILELFTRHQVPPADPRQLPEILTPKDVAKHLRVTPRTIRTWIASGYLPCMSNVGGKGKHARWQMSRAAFQKWMKTHITTGDQKR